MSVPSAPPISESTQQQPPSYNYNDPERGPPPQYGNVGPPPQYGNVGPPPQYGNVGSQPQYGNAGSPPQTYGTADTGSDDFNTFEFSDKTIRMGFIRKVYGILSIQLVVTVLFICMFMFIKPLQVWAHQNTWLFWVAFIMTFVCLIALACCPDVRRKFPMNVIFLGIFTVCEGFLLGITSSTYDTDAVLMAAGITVVVTVALTIFAFQTKIDFTMCSGALFVLTIVLLLFGLICLIVQNRFATIAYASLGALIFSMYLVVDTQMMLGGKHKYSLSPEEYIFAALNLYLDIINLFMFLLTIIGLSRN